jgi:hypothetical protein
VTKKDETKSKADQERVQEREQERQRKMDTQSSDNEETAATEQRDDAATEQMTADQNPVGDTGMQANYDPTGQIAQQGEPLHSTDPNEQARFEQQRQEDIRRAQSGEAVQDEQEERRNQRENTALGDDKK